MNMRVSAWRIVIGVTGVTGVSKVSGGRRDRKRRVYDAVDDLIIAAEHASRLHLSARASAPIKLQVMSTRYRLRLKKIFSLYLSLSSSISVPRSYEDSPLIHNLEIRYCKIYRSIL